MKKNLLKILDGVAEATCYLVLAGLMIGAIYMICDGVIRAHGHLSQQSASKQECCSCPSDTK